MKENQKQVCPPLWVWPWAWKPLLGQASSTVPTAERWDANTLRCPPQKSCAWRALLRSAAEATAHRLDITVLDIAHIISLILQFFVVSRTIEKSDGLTWSTCTAFSTLSIVVLKALLNQYGRASLKSSWKLESCSTFALNKDIYDLIWHWHCLVPKQGYFNLIFLNWKCFFF